MRDSRTQWSLLSFIYITTRKLLYVFHLLTSVQESIPLMMQRYGAVSPLRTMPASYSNLQFMRPNIWPLQRMCIDGSFAIDY